MYLLNFTVRAIFADVAWYTNQICRHVHKFLHDKAEALARLCCLLLPLLKNQEGK